MDANSAIGALDGSAAGVVAAQNQYQQAVKSKKQEMQPAMEQFSKAAESPKPAYPDQKPVGTAPQAQDFQKDSQAWVSALAVLSSVVGSRGRARGTGALKAFAGGMEGLQKGNQQAFENSLKSWKDDSDAIIADNKMLMDKYKAVMDDRSLTEAEADQKMKMIAYENNDEITMKADNYHQRVAMYDIKQKAAERLQEHNEKLQEKADQIKQSTFTPEELKQYAEQWNAGNKAGVIAAARASGGAGSMNINSIKKLAADMNIASGITGSMQAHIDSQYAAERAGMTQTERSLATRVAPAKVAVKEIDNLGKPMVDAISKLDPSQYPDWNSIKNAAEKKTGDPDVIKAALAVQEFKTAVGNLMVRSGVATDQVRATANELASVNFSTKQAQALVDQAKISGFNVLLSLDQAKADIEGKPEPQAPAAGSPAGGAKTIHFNDLPD